MKLASLLTLLLLAGEQVVHEKDSKPVVTLVDRDRNDPYEFRYVIVNGRTEEFSLVVDRESGRIWVCDERSGKDVRYTPDGRVKLGNCAQVYEGIVK